MSDNNERDSSFDHLSPRERAIQSFFKYGSCRAAARHLHMSKSTISSHLRKANIDPKQEGFTEKDKVDSFKPVVDGKIIHTTPLKLDLPKKGKVKRYILSSAQNNTYVHYELVNNIRAFAAKMDAEIKVGRFVYNITKYRQRQGSEKPDAEHNNANESGNDNIADVTAWFDPNIDDWVDDRSLELAPGLVWCGDMQILPTTKSPLSGSDSYQGHNSLIYPHTTIAMESVATGKYEETKFLYTTGTLTQRNYTKTKTGSHGSWNHVYGFLLVEVDSDGDWFVRQVSAKDIDGSFQDFNIAVNKGKCNIGVVTAMTPGDIHNEKLGNDIKEAVFGEGGMVDTIQPEELHIHDLLDFSRRGHHSKNNHHYRYKLHQLGKECVREEVEDVSNFLNYSRRDWMKTVVIHSNHDDHLSRWLNDNPAAYATDFVNSLFFLDLQRSLYYAIHNKDTNFHLFEHACRLCECNEDIVFLRRDPINGYKLHDIECSYHGDKGPNGSRGSKNNLSKNGSKVNIGHSHTAGIKQGAYQAGVMANMDLGYNEGPSSWSRSLILTYGNGKRTIVTMRGTKWRA